jgi:hypothetical protein
MKKGIYMIRTVLLILGIFYLMACSHSTNTKAQRGIANIDTICDDVSIKQLEYGDILTLNQDVSFKSSSSIAATGGYEGAWYEKLISNAQKTVSFKAVLSHPEIREIKKGDKLTVLQVVGKTIQLTSASGKEYQVICKGPRDNPCDDKDLAVLFEKPQRCDNYNVTPIKDEKHSHPETPVEI